MGQQVRKDKKCCGTCAYWAGRARLMNSNTVEVLSGFYEKCPCDHKPRIVGTDTDFQRSCSKWEQRFR